MRGRSPGRSGHALPKRRATTRGQATLQLYAARYTRQPAPAGRRETLRPPTEANTQRPLSSPEGGCQDRGPIPTEHIKKATEGSGKPAGAHFDFALGLSNEVGPPQRPSPESTCTLDANPPIKWSVLSVDDAFGVIGDDSQ